jgi:curved DNA-binding protein CbpA
VSATTSTTSTTGVELAGAAAGIGVRRAHARELAAGVVQNLYRLLKVAQLHALENTAVRRQLEATASCLAEYALRAGEGATIFFARGVVFIAGEPLKAPRTVYDAAAELAEMLERLGGAEIAFAPETSLADLRHFVRAAVQSLREAGTRFSDFELRNVRVRAVSDAALLRGIDAEHLPPEARIVRTYASAVVILRRFFEALGQGDLTLPKRIKRVAQSLVDLSAGRTPAFLGVTAVRNANHDDAGRAVNAAILAVAMARQLTSDKIVLTRIAMAAMLHDVGRPRATRAMRLEGDDAAPLVARLGEEAERALPAGATAMLTALGRVNEPSMVRTVVAYEALWLAREAELGAPYRGLRPPTLHARIVSVAHAYNALLTPAPGEAALAPWEAQLALEQRTAGNAAARTVLRLLTAALGTAPPGTLVQLSSGEIAVVADTVAGRLHLQLVLDAQGGIPEERTELALGQDERRIVKVVGNDPSFAARRASARADLSSVSSVTGATGAGASGVTSAPSISGVSRVPSAPPATLGPRSEVRRVADEDSLSKTPSPVTLRSASGAPSRPPPIAPPLPEPDDDARTLVWRSPLDEASEREAHEAHEEGATRGRLPAAAKIEIEAPPSWRTGADSIFTPRTMPVSAPPSSEPLSSRRPPPSSRPSSSPSSSPTSHPSSASSRPASRPEPDVRGAMARSPFPHLLVQVLRRALSGSLVLRADAEGAHVVAFEDGRPTKLHTTRPAPRLGELLVARGLVTADVVERAAARAHRAGQLLGRQLVGEGALGAREITAALHEQHVARLAALATLPREGTYEFYTGHDLLPNVVPLQVDPLQLLMVATRAWADEAVMDAQLRKLGARPIALHPASALERFGLDEEERLVVEWATSGKLAYAQVLEAELAPLIVARRVLYTLAATAHLDLGGGEFPLGVDRDDFPMPVGFEPEDAGRASFAPGALSMRIEVDVPPASVRTPPAPDARLGPPPRAPASAPGPLGSRPPASVPGSLGPLGSRPPRGPRLGTPPPPRVRAEGPASSPPISRPPVSAPISRPPASAPISAPPATPSTASPSAATRPVAAPSAPPAPPAPSAEHLALRAAILERAADLDAKTHHEVLGVPRDASAEAIRAAFLDAAKRFHPDRLPAPLEDVRAQATSLFAALGEANRVLSDPALRGAYEEEHGGATKAARRAELDEVERVLEASLLHEKAGILLKRQDVAGAEQMLVQAVQLDPKQGSAFALLAWVRSIRSGADLKDALALAERAALLQPEDSRVLYYRGTILKRLDRMSEAIRDFRHAAELDKQNLDAVREVRLFELRAQKKPEKGDERGFLGKLFGGKPSR